jgi:hypothetical protein
MTAHSFTGGRNANITLHSSTGLSGQVCSSFTVLFKLILFDERLFHYVVCRHILHQRRNFLPSLPSSVQDGAKMAFMSR